MLTKAQNKHQAIVRVFNAYKKIFKTKILKILNILFIALVSCHVAVSFGAENVLSNKPKPKYCPLAKELTKEDMKWKAGKMWQSYSESFANEVQDFIGAQWYGVNLGKIICLYRGNIDFEFAIALEQRVIMVVLEPKGPHWSGLIGDRKFCKSTNVFDCQFFNVVTDSVNDVYESIKYQTKQPTRMQRDLDF